MAKRHLDSDCEVPKSKRRCLEQSLQNRMHNTVLNFEKSDVVNSGGQMSINEDGPCLSNDNMKKKPNSADQFNKEQQGPYETREKGNKDDVEAINEYNSTYPKMKNELEKRRSIAKPKELKLKKSSDIKILKNDNNSRSKVVKRLYRNKPVKKRQNNKPKTNQRRRAQSRRHNDIYSEFCAFFDEIGKFYDLCILEIEMQMAAVEDERELNDKMSKIRQVSADVPVDQKSESCPPSSLEGSNASVTTYNSFGSISKEPTVSGSLRNY